MKYGKIDFSNPTEIQDVLVRSDVSNPQECSMAVANIVRSFTAASSYITKSDSLSNELKFVASTGGEFGSLSEHLDKSIHGVVQNFLCRVDFEISKDEVKMVIMRYELDNFRRGKVDGVAYAQGKTDSLNAIEFDFYGRPTLDSIRTTYHDEYVEGGQEDSIEADKYELISGIPSDKDVCFGAFVYAGRFRKDVEPDSVVRLDLTGDLSISVYDVFSEIDGIKRHY